MFDYFSPIFIPYLLDSHLMVPLSLGSFFGTIG
jgi:hypothetical protein